MKGLWFVVLASAIIVQLALCAQPANAQTGSIKLLAIAETENGTTGSLATLSLEIRPGSDRVFLETVPLTKVATQISMRFAQQQACKALRIDCSDKDFIYTINSQPGLVGGPSAGAAAAVLTASLLGDIPLQEDVAMTGTINSGGMIGPVGGIKEKIEAASTTDIKTVLVPRGARISIGENVSVSMEEWSKERNVSVREVATLDEALYFFSGVNVSRSLPVFVIEPAYADRLKAVSSLICNRTIKLAVLARKEHKDDNTTKELISEGRNNTLRAAALMRQDAYYSAASFCFRANVDFNLVVTRKRNENREQLGNRMRQVREGVANLTVATDRKNLTTVTDLQAFMSVQERLLETTDVLDAAADSLADDKEAAQTGLVYAEERYASALSWSGFFGLPGDRREIDNEALRQSCYQKISEAEERFSYVRTFFPDSLVDTRRDLDRAQADATNGKFALCLGKASKAKAEADVILSAYGFEDKDIDGLISLRRGLAERSLMQAQQDGWFPLIGFNYYQYGGDLQDDDPYSALLFTEYALEYGDTDMYFRPQQDAWRALERQIEMTTGTLLMFIVTAAAAGIALGSGIRLRQQRKEAKERAAQHMSMQEHMHVGPAHACQPPQGHVHTLGGRNDASPATGREQPHSIVMATRQGPKSVSKGSPSSSRAAKPSPTPLAGRRRGKKR
jgi:uncharacterized protein